MSNTLDPRRLTWVKSTYSDGQGGQCVEWSPSYARTHGLVPVRDSKTPTAPPLLLTPTAFAGLLTLARLS
ncbi:DUF397 domain-containing protein [Streptomyces sp. 4F14]|uniref:DUF397 domain-containing protein n=1 Tax=Streptomyces sp. 4F14 TaxID=3394380 RepID=UPI003A88C148